MRIPMTESHPLFTDRTPLETGVGRQRECEMDGIGWMPAGPWGHRNARARSRARRIAWCWLRHPVTSHGFPAEAERLVTVDELYRYMRRGADHVGR